MTARTKAKSRANSPSRRSAARGKAGVAPKVGKPAYGICRTVMAALLSPGSAYSSNGNFSFRQREGRNFRLSGESHPSVGQPCDADERDDVLLLRSVSG